MSIEELQREFEEDYRRKVRNAAITILSSLLEEADSSHIESDIYIRHVVNEIQKEVAKL